jgi:Domain of unknown function (DUF4399)
MMSQAIPMRHEKKRGNHRGRICRFFSGLIVTLIGIAGFAPASSGQNAGKRSTAPQGVVLYFHFPRDGVAVPTRFKVRIGLRGMGVAPAGIQKAGTGHHHLLVDTELTRWDRPIPNDPQHLHLGNGQTEIEVVLPPGRHVLQLVLADHEHIPHDPPVVSRRISVMVRDSEAVQTQ